jgi:hypothetical protein
MSSPAAVTLAASLTLASLLVALVGTELLCNLGVPTKAETFTRYTRFALAVGLYAPIFLLSRFTR